MDRSIRAYLIRRALVCGVLTVLLILAVTGAYADVPAAARPYRAQLVREAHSQWGLDAPVAAFAAQIEQESAWRADAVSRVGAQGLAQFMPATARWWCSAQQISSRQCLPRNPTWALRALIGYDRWLWERIPSAYPYERMWATLRAYNGGLGHWLAEARTAADMRRESVDAACGSARRARVHCLENLGYPRRILLTLQPVYRGWGGVVLQP